MRDPKRIDRILKEFENTWKKYPDMRFYQLLINMEIIHDDNNLWHYEDDDLEKKLKRRPLK